MSSIMGYQVANAVTGEYWGDRPSFEILTEQTAIKDIQEARESGQVGWVMHAILAGDIEEPTYESDFLENYDTYRTTAISTAHLSESDKELLSYLALRDDFQLIMERDAGYFIKIYEDVECYADETVYSDNLLGLILSAHQAGFRMIEFDTDAPPMKSAELFEALV